MRANRHQSPASLTVLGGLALILLLGPASAGALRGQSLDIPAKTWGLSFGNSRNFTGLRFNFRDSRVERITGVNVTLWRPKKDDKDAVVTGLSLGLGPGGGRLRGVQIGLVGAGAEVSMTGLNIGGLGIGAGDDVVGINIGGIGLGAGKNLTGISIGGLGAGAGEDLRGLAIGGLGVGAGEEVRGICIGGLGAGAGASVKGIGLGGLGIGAGDDLVGVAVGGLGAGCGRDLTGVVIAGLGAGAGDKLTGLAICGLAAGAPKIRGVVIGGVGAGGQDLKGAFFGLAMIRVEKGGRLTGLAASSFNHIRGTLNGVSVGIVNY